MKYYFRSPGEIEIIIEESKKLAYGPGKVEIVIEKSLKVEIIFENSWKSKIILLKMHVEVEKLLKSPEKVETIY